jgi:hypothetical protein
MASAGVALILCGLSAVRAWCRQSAARRALPMLAAKLRWAAWFDILAGPVVGLVSWLTMLSSAFGDRITWRGVRYRIRPGGQIGLVHRRPPPKTRSDDIPTAIRFPQKGDSESLVPTPKLREYGSAAA